MAVLTVMFFATGASQRSLPADLLSPGYFIAKTISTVTRIDFGAHDLGTGILILALDAGCYGVIALVPISMLSRSWSRGGSTPKLL